jgi:hypothetical protein
MLYPLSYEGGAFSLPPLCERSSLVLYAASIRDDMNPCGNAHFDGAAHAHSLRASLLAVLMVTRCHYGSSDCVLGLDDMTAEIDKLTPGRITNGIRGYSSLCGRPPRKSMSGGCISKGRSC